MLPNDLLEEVEKYISKKDLCSFLRVGLVEKLNRDFDANIDPERYSGGRGFRSDMFNESGRARAEAQLAEARRSRKVRMLEREARARAKEEIERSAAKGSSPTRSRRAA